MKVRTLCTMAVVAGVLSISACGEAAQTTGGAGGVGGEGGDGGAGGVGGGGGGGSAYEVCTLGLCMEDESLAASCLEVYDVCVGQGHYPRCCRMDADKTCGVFGETGPY